MRLIGKQRDKLENKERNRKTRREIGKQRDKQENKERNRKTWTKI